MMSKSLRNVVASAFYAGLIVAGGTLLASAPASAALCASTTNCSLTFTQGNSGSAFGTGTFGTLGLSLSGNTVTVSVSLASGFRIVNTGFPGSFGFSDSLGGGLTIGNFSSAAYSGALSHAASDLHFDGFGFFNNAAATTGPSAGSASAVGSVSFTVFRAGLIDVNQLLNLANPAGGDGLAYFVVDVFNGNTSGPGAGNTGLIAITGNFPPNQTPEPQTLALVGLGLFSLALLRRQRRA
jgi:hypothetical protein